MAARDILFGWEWEFDGGWECERERKSSCQKDNCQLNFENNWPGECDRESGTFFGIIRKKVILNGKSQGTVRFILEQKKNQAYCSYARKKKFRWRRGKRAWSGAPAKPSQRWKLSFLFWKLNSIHRQSRPVKHEGKIQSREEKPSQVSQVVQVKSKIH